MSISWKDDPDTSELTKKWLNAVLDLHFAHPDPEVKVELHYANTDDGNLEFQFTFYNAINTETKERLSEWGVQHTFHANYWPGDQAARYVAVAVWSAIMLHEGLELITNGAGDKVVDPHHPTNEKAMPYEAARLRAFDKGDRRSHMKLLELIMSKAAAKKVLGRKRASNTTKFSDAK